MLLSRCKLKIYSRRPGELLQPKHIELMGHVIFAWTVVLVGRIQSKVCDLTTVKARKSLDLCKHAKRKINPKKNAKDESYINCQRWQPTRTFSTGRQTMFKSMLPDEQIGSFDNPSS